MLPIFVGLMLVSFANAQQQAVAVLTGSITGEIVFTEKSDTVYITGTVSGLTEGNHGFHIHSKGDLRNGCTSTGSHFNPLNVTHGGPTSSTRHVGDLGNIAANSSGIALIDITDSIIALRGDNNIVGRAVVVHADHDDLGKGGFNDSLTTGHAGGRLGCGIIGLVSETSGSAGLIPILTTALVAIAITVQRIL